jgi:16S rRNA C967 or C1407 C5-methylase (RsmB/RsmF family)
MLALLGSLEEVEALFVAANELSEHHHGRALRPNPRRAVPEWKELLESYVGPRVPWCPDAHFWIPEAQVSPQAKRHLKLLQAVGALWIQEASALEVVESLPLSNAQDVLDLCAAPGSKSSHLISQMNPSARLWCHDVNESRAHQLNALLARWGAESLRVSTGPLPQLSFDLVLLDAPCTGETLFAKRRDQRRDVSDREVQRAAGVQRRLIREASDRVRPGGHLMYSTCAYNRMENEDVVSDFLGAQTREWRLVRQGRKFPHRDKVPGGAWFLLQCSPNASADPRTELTGSGPKILLEGDGGGRDSEICEFRSAVKLWPRAELSDLEALAVSQGQSIPNNLKLNGNVLSTWRSLPLAPLRALPDRLNNLLPKRLREL